MATRVPKKDTETAAADRAAADRAATDRTATDRTERARERQRDAAVTDAAVRDEVVAQERAAFGGMKFGSAFFGWLTAAGLGAVLTALVAAIGAAVELTDGNDDVDTTTEALARASEYGLGGAIALAVIGFIAYFAGGYVAGRMARFNGGIQGLAVWLWAVIVAIVGALVALGLGDRFDILANLDAFPRIPLYLEEMTVGTIVLAIVLAAVALIAAVLGGMAGMRFHRRVDQAGVVVVED